MTIPNVLWDETAPPDTQSAGLGDDRIREMKVQVREVVDVDHQFNSSGQDAENGMHTIIRFLLEAGTPITDSDHIQLYERDVGGVTELFLKDTAGNEIQITDGGGLGDVVTLTGVQTITGVKTFEADPTLLKSNLVATPYAIGTVTTVNGSANVVGAATLWDTDDNIKVGQAFFVAGDDRYYTIQTITDDTHLVLTVVYAGTGAAGQTYEVVPLIDGVPIGNHKEATLLDHPDGSVETAKLADNAVSVADHVYASSAQVIASATYVDLDTMEITLTTSGITGSAVMIDYAMSADANGSGTHAHLWGIIEIDGATEADSEMKKDATTDDQSMLSGCFLKTGLTAGAHTFKVQVKQSGGVPRIYQRMLRVVELKK